MPVQACRREAAKALIDRAIRKTLKTTDSGAKRSLARLIWNVQLRSELLRPCRPLGGTLAEHVERLLGGIATLAAHHKDWYRLPEEWEPTATNRMPLFSSLAHHLLAEYEVPPVFLSVWFLGSSPAGAKGQRLYKHLGRGGSLRTASLYVPVSRRMAYELTHAPEGLPFPNVVRWAQVRGLGGDERLAEAVAATMLGGWYYGDEFWRTVIHFFINNPLMDTRHVKPIVDYVYDQKYRHQPVIIGESTEIRLDPPQPDFSMKGRTPASLRRLLDAWNVRDRPPARRRFAWPRAAINEYTEGRYDGRVWAVREILDSDALAAEGAAMHHCVADYTEACLKRSTTIWSVGIEGPEARERVVTVEVEPGTRVVVQAKMACNETPDEFAKGLIGRWAAREGLNLETCDWG